MHPHHRQYLPATTLSVDELLMALRYLQETDELTGEKRTDLLVKLVSKRVTYKRIGEALGISSGRVSQIADRYVRKVKHVRQQAEQRIKEAEQGWIRAALGDKAYATVVPKEYEKLHDSARVILYRRPKPAGHYSQHPWEITYHSARTLVEPINDSLGSWSWGGMYGLAEAMEPELQLGKIQLTTPDTNLKSVMDHCAGLDAEFRIVFKYNDVYEFHMSVEIEPGGEASSIVPATLRLHQSKMRDPLTGGLKDLTYLIYSIQERDEKLNQLRKQQLDEIRANSYDGAMVVSLGTIPGGTGRPATDLLVALNVMRIAVDQYEACLERLMMETIA